MGFSPLLILFGVFFLIFQNALISAQKCGGYSLKSLRKELIYEPDGGGAPLNIRRARKHGFSGSFGKVFVGYVKHQNRSAGVTCVAIKMYEQSNYEEFKNSKEFMQNIQNTLPADKRKHLITLLDTGEMKETKGALIIMELGVASLEARIYRQRKAYGSDAHLFEDIKKIVEPLKDMHQVAVHLDVKPSNFVYVNEPDGTESLKLIDFDGASFIPSNIFNFNSSKMANKVVPCQTFLITWIYAAPEFFNATKTVTTKVDIWSLGMSIYEIILLQKRFNENISKKKMAQFLLETGDLYLGINRTKQENLFDTPSWIRNNYEILMTILNVWQKYPKTALLIANVLHPDREIRLSAIGVKKFLDGSCITAELNSVQDSWELNFLNGFTFQEFYGLLESKRKAFCAGCTSALKYEALQEKIDQILFIVQRAMNELKSHWLLQLLNRTCETERNR